ncbi:cysteine hydrolase family protein [Aquabacter cavernae]|uniref:cysteine hydrolase family protein n=1 Tax=Aquabacter cavernae TaxID=2496029 RepID=UPI000F8F3702|nr:cysteine hydrolase family protein [Aquabacter cavernae]
MCADTTTHPRTLLDFAGASLKPGRLREAALVLIDYQLEYTVGALALPDAAAALEEAGRLLEAGRAHGATIFHIVHHGRPGGRLFDPEGPYAAVADPVRPKDGEAVIFKPLPNAFEKTGLHQQIELAGRKELIIAGFMTHMCVSATARAALDLGYRSTVVGRACATRDLPDPLGGVVSADALHRASLAGLGDRFAIIAPDTAALLKED